VLPGALRSCPIPPSQEDSSDCQAVRCRHPEVRAVARLPTATIRKFSGTGRPIPVTGRSDGGSG